MTQTRINNGILEFKVSSIENDLKQELAKNINLLEKLKNENSRKETIAKVENYISIINGNLKKEWI